MFYITRDTNRIQPGKWTVLQELMPAKLINQLHEEAISEHFGSRFLKALAFDPDGAPLEDHLCKPAFCLKTRIQIRRDDGTLAFFPAWRIRFPEILGPCKGGVRFHEGVSESTLTTLAARILVKCAANGLPHGGAAGGIQVDAKALSAREHMALAQAYVTAYADVIGENKDILSPDLGTNSRTMAWMSMQLNSQRRHFEPGGINGKPIALGGVQGRHGSTAIGARIVLERLLEFRRLQLKGITAAIQGFGAAGGTLAIELAQHGVKVVAVSDSSGGWQDPKGLNVVTLLDAKISGRPLAGQQAGGATRISPEGALEVPADLIIAAGTGAQINRENAGRLQCRFVVEIANAAVTDEAEVILGERGIEIVPDIVVNSGGITVSHFEWVQNRTGAIMTAAEVHEKLVTRMRSTADRWLDEVARTKVSLTVAAQLLAIGRIKEALNP